MAKVKKIDHSGHWETNKFVPAQKPKSPVKKTKRRTEDVLDRLA